MICVFWCFRLKFGFGWSLIDFLCWFFVSWVMRWRLCFKRSDSVLCLRLFRFVGVLRRFIGDMFMGWIIFIFG